ncbi:general transcription factor IIE subunit 1 isoform X2 [Ischnura elegans]|uniref:general transcription factor IIE subunit 1 isoform X2 n=1 Tax=Ischnura elegans TaxID=197161 RepID=UPI001ED8A198|nr:general transcription factor IIE subunit 1 isoform X2 [Ischnura elegans]
MEDRVLTEVPSSLKQLARLVVRGFYNIEDALIVDMLVRNPCMKEDDLCELLKFERKMLRARISTLRSDKFIQTFVNVVKYKLDLMRKRMETEERDATSRASFKCPSCCKTFTDLEADQLFDFATEEFRCTYCKEVVEEDQSALPKKDSRLLLAKFNEQLEPLFVLLREVEGIRLAPEVLEPEPTDLSSIKGFDKGRPSSTLRPPGDPSGPWSGDATRGGGFQVEETRVDVTIGDESADNVGAARKERPIWMVESTIISDNNDLNGPASGSVVIQNTDSQPAADQKPGNKNAEDIMSVLLAHEKRAGATSGAVATAAATASLSTRGAVAGLVRAGESGSESSDDEASGNPRGGRNNVPEMDSVVEAMDSDDAGEDGDDDDLVPMVEIGNRSVPITDIDDALIAQMTPAEKEAYIQVYQEHYSHMYD